MRSISRNFAAWLSLCAGAAMAAGLAAVDASKLFLGRFDNREQAEKSAGAAEPVPRVTVTVEATPQDDFTLWHVHLETDPQTSFDQTWAMQSRIEADGSAALIPYYQLRQEAPPAAATFDPQGWLSLEACALRGTFGATRVEAMSEGAPCVAVSMSVGARRALLPVGLRGSRELLHLDFNLRGVRTDIEAQPAR